MHACIALDVPPAARITGIGERVERTPVAGFDARCDQLFVAGSGEAHRISLREGFAQAPRDLLGELGLLVRRRQLQIDGAPPRLLVATEWLRLQDRGRRRE